MRKIGSALLLVAVLVAPALAAGGNKGGQGGSTLTLVVLGDPTLAGSTAADPPHRGDAITFEVSTTATDQPFVNVQCHQGGAFVYDAWEGFYPAAWSDQIFTLSSNSWQSGAADCSARLVMWGRNGRQRTLTTMDFHVEA